MNSFRHAATRAPLNARSALVMRPLAIANENIYGQLLRTQRANLHSFTSDAALLRPVPLRSKFLPDDIRVGYGSASSRGFHQGARLAKNKDTKTAATEEPAKAKAAEEATEEKPESATGEEKTKEEAGKEDDGEGKEEAL